MKNAGPQRRIHTAANMTATNTQSIRSVWPATSAPGSMPAPNATGKKTPMRTFGHTALPVSANAPIMEATPPSIIATRTLLPGSWMAVA